jgi:two-component system, chemotaxis family, protein-glutamate methylesterase/glutaminase
LPHRDIIVVGASVGGVGALQTLVRNLPERLPASVFIVLHLSPDSPSLLPEILERAGELPVVHPRDNDRIREGQVYVAPPDRHLLLDRDCIRVVVGPKENRHRPAIDPLFRSAALAYGPRVVGVVLTGALDDGTAGLISVKQRGGLAIVQDPETAYCGDMPRSSLRYVEADFVLPTEQIGAKLNELVRQPLAQTEAGGNGKLNHDVAIAEMDLSTMNASEHPGDPSPFACPECNGVLWEKKEGDLLHFRCRVGHAYTASNLVAEQNLGVESALWAALRALEENASLNERLAERARARRASATAQHFAETAQTKKSQAATLRKLLLEGQFHVSKN